MHIIGVAGTGKSTLMEAMILDDVRRGGSYTLVEQMTEAPSGPAETIEPPDHNPFEQAGVQCQCQFLHTRPVHGPASELVRVPDHRAGVNLFPSLEVGNLRRIILAGGADPYVNGGVLACWHARTPCEKKVDGLLMPISKMPPTERSAISRRRRSLEARACIELSVVPETDSAMTPAPMADGDPSFVFPSPPGIEATDAATERRELGRRAWRKVKTICDLLQLQAKDPTQTWRRRFPRGPNLKAFRSGISCELQLNGSPLAYVQNQLGHHDQTITLEHYTHLLPELVGQITKSFISTLGAHPHQSNGP